MLNTSEFCRMAGIQRRALDAWAEAGWVHPSPTRNGWQFSTIDLARARFILDLQGPMGVNEEGIAVILHLVDQIHGLRMALHSMSSTKASGVSRSSAIRIDTEEPPRPYEPSPGEGS